ncbi:MAG: aldo/keto reductase [Oscillospiraceae bacterium]|nr:aldo/keto reductase [Oscillospiraceae bacterium]
MKYVELGKTGLKCAAVSFGGIPIQRSDAANTLAVVDALEKHGMNYIDTARGYTVSEEYLGAALKGRRDKFILATKSMVRDYEGMKKEVETSLHNLQTDYIDVYQLHNLPLGAFDQVFGPEGAYRALAEAKEAGKIGHIGATFHSLDALKKVVEEYSDKIETVMFPFNIVESQGTETLKLAREKGMGTICMKPMAGGNLTDWTLALRFIDAAGVMDISIPGMGSVEEVERNAAAAETLSPLTEEELAKCEAIRKELGTTFCRRCGYCAPCTVGINIPSAFLFNNYLQHYEGLADWARGRYAAMDHKADECIQCGLCESRCPYELPIRDMLKEVAKAFER